MKTSFAKTMKFLSGQTKEKSQDLLSNENTAKYVLTIDGVQISKENIFVVNGDEEMTLQDLLSIFLQVLT